MQENVLSSVIDTKKNKLKRHIISELYRNESRTIPQLAGLLQTSIPSTRALIDELSIGHWVQEIGTGTAQYGRKPSLFALDSNQYVTVVIDINVHDTKVLVFDLANQVLHRLDVNLQLDTSDTFLNVLVEPLEQIAHRIKEKKWQVIGIGTSLPGLVDSRAGINHTYPNLNQPDESLTDLLRTLFNAPVYLLNDTKAIIFGEYCFGLAQGKNNALSINIDWGIGFGVIINGEILQGAAGFAGELGHIQMKTDGDLCACGKVGCLETIASASSLIKRAKTELGEGRASLLAEMDIDRIGIESIIEKAGAGDAYSIDLLSDVGNELGRALSTAVHLFNPELIIVNGVLAKADKAITRPIEQAIAKYCLLNYRDNLTIEISELGEMAKLYGIQAYVIQNLLDQELVP